MKYWLISPVAVLCLGSAAWTKNPSSFSKTPERPASAQRQRELDDRQQLMLDGHPAASKYAAQPASATQPVTTPALPPTQVISPPAAIPCDCESTGKIPPRQWRRLLLEEQCAAARDMVPHYASKAPYDGAYYFRPYTAQQIGKQADIVGSWGLDRTNPYDNRFLQAIYDQPRQSKVE